MYDAFHSVSREELVAMTVKQATFADEVSVNTLAEVWKNVLKDVSKTLGPGCCQSWFLHAFPCECSDGTILLQTNQRIVRDRLSSQYNRELLTLWRKYLPQVSSVEVIMAAANDAVTDIPSATSRYVGLADIRSEEDEDADSPVQEKAESLSPHLDVTESQLDPRFKFDNFVVGKPNEFAYAAAMSVADSEAIQFNPLFLYGGVGLGKTHLMHAIAWKMKAAFPEKMVMYLSAEQFMYQFIRALRFKNVMSFKEQLRNVDVLMIDDFQFIGGKEATQEEFFHTFNSLVDNNKQVIISADKSPSSLDNIGERLKSRLGCGLVADIHPTTYELRLGILQSKAARMGVNFPKWLIEFVAAKITSNVRELEGALNRIVAHASLIGASLTLDVVQEVLRDLIRSNERCITIEDIQKRVCEFFSVKIGDLLSSKRVRSLVKPRQIAMYLCKTLTTKSLPEIGRLFGGKDHATVIHASKRVIELCNEDPEVARSIEVLKALLSV